MSADEFGEEPTYVNITALASIEANLRLRAAIVLEGPRGAGKTSVLRYIETKMRREGDRDVVYLRFPEVSGKQLQVISALNELASKLVLLDNAEQWPLEFITQILADIIAADGRIVMAAPPGFAAELSAAIPSLENRIRRIELPGFRASDLRELLTRQFGERLTDDEIQRAIAEADGSPRRAVELAHEILGGRSVGEGHYYPVAASPESLDFLVDPGDATADDLARLYSALSDIYRAYGGTGLIFDPDGTSIVIQAGQPI